MFSFSEKTNQLSQKVLLDLKSTFDEIEIISQKNQEKVLKAFINNKVSEANFNQTTGYGYGDNGRDVLDKIYAEVFGGEDALVRHNIVSGTHALTIALFSFLRPGDTIVSAVGKPYDTLEKVISGDSGGSLKEFGIAYEEVPLKEGKVDFEKLKEAVLKKPKGVLIQRSMGYGFRKALSVEEIGKIISFIKEISPDTICMVDNCYGEFTEEKEPCEVGADLAVGSLIKNPGGSLAMSGGYIVGRKDLVELASQRHTVPDIGKECGASLGQNRFMYQGLFLAPHIVSQAVKSAAFCGGIMEELGFEVCPKPNGNRSDIIQAIKFNDPKKLISFCKSIQSASPIDSFVTPEPWDMPGYSHKVIMAAGTFVSGASIEISADGPIKEPYIAYLQGGITFESAKLAILKAVEDLEK